MNNSAPLYIHTDRGDLQPGQRHPGGRPLHQPGHQPAGAAEGEGSTSESSASETDSALQHTSHLVFRSKVVDLMGTNCSLYHFHCNVAPPPPARGGSCCSDRHARYTRTQTNSAVKELSHHFASEKPCGKCYTPHLSPCLPEKSGGAELYGWTQVTPAAPAGTELPPLEQQRAEMPCYGYHQAR
jgi:hypothetical protein